MSKTIGNTVDPYEIIEKYGVEPLRYYLLSQIPTLDDGDFTEERFREVYQADLANGLGNLVSRVAKLCETSGFISEPLSLEFSKRIQKHLTEFRLDKALNYIWFDVEWGIRWLDQKINEEEPWKHDKEYQHLKLHLYVQNIRKIAYNLKPFLPKTAEKILKQFGGPKIKSGKPLFPRLH